MCWGILGTWDVLQHALVWGMGGKRLWGHLGLAMPLTPPQLTSKTRQQPHAGSMREPMQGLICGHALIRGQWMQTLSTRPSRGIWREKRPGHVAMTASEIRSLGITS